MKNSKFEKSTFIEVELVVKTRRRDSVSAYADVVSRLDQSAFYAAKGIDIVSALEVSLSRSLGFFFPSNSIVAVNVREISPSLVGVFLPFCGRDTYHIASKLAADILAQIL